MHRRTTRRLAALPLAVLLLFAACGDDDSGDDTASGATSTTEADDTSTTTEGEGGETGAYCDAELALETLGEPDIDFEAMSPEEQAEAAKQYAAESLRPAADEVLALAPSELEENFAVLDEALTEVENTGDFSQLESPEFMAAQQAVHEYDLESCGWESIAVTAIDYGFQGIPTSVPSGETISFEFTNATTREESHELVILKKNEGVTQSAAELLELPEEEAMTKAQFINATFAEPGGESYVVVDDLEAGDYFAACFIPTGATEENEAGTGPPHFMQGMVVEFSVE